jgi:hypothetical protein
VEKWKMQILPRLFYEFHRYRVVSRAGQPIQVQQNFEIGPIISREDAGHQLKNGKDTYTFHRSDAEKLAAQLYDGNPKYEPPHRGSYFQHFHPGGKHGDFPANQTGRPRTISGEQEKTPGHVYFGSRGENYVS